MSVEASKEDPTWNLLVSLLGRCIATGKDQTETATVLAQRFDITLRRQPDPVRLAVRDTGTR